jgi:hypothetical protein
MLVYVLVAAIWSDYGAGERASVITALTGALRFLVISTSLSKS